MRPCLSSSDTMRWRCGMSVVSGAREIDGLSNTRMIACFYTIQCTHAFYLVDVLVLHPLPCEELADDLVGLPGQRVLGLGVPRRHLCRVCFLVLWCRLFGLGLAGGSVSLWMCMNEWGWINGSMAWAGHAALLKLDAATQTNAPLSGKRTWLTTMLCVSISNLASSCFCYLVCGVEV